MRAMRRPLGGAVFAAALLGGAAFALAGCDDTSPAPSSSGTPSSPGVSSSQSTSPGTVPSTTEPTGAGSDGPGVTIEPTGGPPDMSSPGITIPTVEPQ